METVFQAVMIGAGLIVISGVTFLAVIFALGIARGQVFYGGRFWDIDVFLDALGGIRSGNAPVGVSASEAAAIARGRRASDRLYSVDLRA